MNSNKSVLDRILDYSVIFSFDRSGFERHKKHFDDDLEMLNGKRVLITGGGSGIGATAASDLTKLGAEVTITGRTESKLLIQKNQGYCEHIAALDMADWKSFDEVSEKFHAFDIVVLNAGGMPEHYQTNHAGVEHQIASQLIGHYLLVNRLRLKGLLKSNARIIWVSSGGMYLRKWDGNRFQSSEKDYDKVAAYANTKRGQVILSDLMASHHDWSNFQIYSMHPGWVVTPGLEGALPGFTGFMNKRLRTSDQGADTIVWLASTKSPLLNGKLYFDRSVVSPYAFWWTKESLEQQSKLWDDMNSFC